MNHVLMITRVDDLFEEIKEPEYNYTQPWSQVHRAGHDLILQRDGYQSPAIARCSGYKQVRHTFQAEVASRRPLIKRSMNSAIGQTGT